MGSATLTHAPTRTTSIEYAGLTTHATDAVGVVTEVVSDLAGRVTDQWVYAAGGTRSAGQHTQYGYGRAADGTVTSSVTDAEGALTSTVTNMGGQKLSITDPNAGETSYEYDARGQVTQTVNDGSGTVTLAYDELGRLTDRTTTLPGGATSSSAQWVFDDSPGHVGQLMSSSATTVVGGSAYDVTRTYAYDTLGRVTASTVSLPTWSRLGDLSGVDYVEAYTINELGQVTATSLPSIGDLSAETVTSTFNRFGDTVGLATTASPSALVAGFTRTTTGQAASRTLGDGMVREYGWDPMDGSLTWAQASYDDDGTQTWVQYDVYDHDDAGRVTSVTDKVVGTTTGGDLAQCYTYDDLNRLAAAWTANASDACGSDGTQTSTWAVAVTGYSAQWSYSLAGRITSAHEAVVTSAGTDAVTRSYDYDGDSPAAVTDVTTTGTGGSSADGFTYDDAGRMITRNTGSGTQTLTWDPTSNLVSVTGGGVNDTYLYDTTGQRVARVTATTATAYFGATEATDPDTNASTTGDVQATRFYTAGGATVAMRTTSGISYLLGDVQGSATVTITAGDPATATVSRNAYAPYGVTRGADQLATDRGWLGQTEDTSTGLTYLNARYYDPVIARFISPDPLLSPADPNTLDPYAYAANNPISFTDASGLCYGKGGRAIPECMGGSQKTGAKYNQVQRDHAKKQSAKAPPGTTVDPGGAPRRITHSPSTSGMGPKKTYVPPALTVLFQGDATTGGSSGTGRTDSDFASCSDAIGYLACHDQQVQCEIMGTNACPLSYSVPSPMNWGWRISEQTQHKFRYLGAAMHSDVVFVSGVMQLWAELHNATCSWSSAESLMVCGGASSGFGGNGTNYGLVYVTGNATADVLDPNNDWYAGELQHEGEHTLQDAFFGVTRLFLLRTAGEAVTGLDPRYDFGDGCDDPVEISAGLEGGHYPCG